MAADTTPCAATGPPRAGYAPAIPAIGLCLLALITALYHFDAALYFVVLRFLIQVPWTSPFLDWVNIPATIECFGRGVDIYVAVPCDPLNRSWTYSPLWLHLTFIPTGAREAVWTGFGLTVLFIASLGFLPRARSSAEFAVVLAGCCSSATWYLLERGNIDHVMFLFVIAVGLCLERGLRVRLIGYGLIVLAGLLKFYPIVLLVLLLRERPVIGIAIGSIATALVAGVAYANLGDVLAALRNVPRFGYLDNGMWAATSLPGGLAVLLDAIARAAGLQGEWVATLRASRWVGLSAVAMLGVGVLAGAIGLNWGHAFRRAFAALPRRDAIFLLLGAAIICGCFFAVQNIVYRGVFMLLTLPGLMKLANSDMPPALRRVVAATLVAVLYVLWNFTLQQVVYATTGVVLRPITNGPIIAYLYWLSQQLAIWWVVATLLAVLASFALHSTAVRALFAARRRPSPA